MEQHFKLQLGPVLFGLCIVVAYSIIKLHSSSSVFQAAEAEYHQAEAQLLSDVFLEPAGTAIPLKSETDPLTRLWRDKALPALYILIILVLSFGVALSLLSIHRRARGGGNWLAVLRRVCLTDEESRDGRKPAVFAALVLLALVVILTGLRLGLVLSTREYKKASLCLQNQSSRCDDDDVFASYKSNQVVFMLHTAESIEVAPLRTATSVYPVGGNEEWRTSSLSEDRSQPYEYGDSESANSAAKRGQIPTDSMLLLKNRPRYIPQVQFAWQPPNLTNWILLAAGIIGLVLALFSHRGNSALTTQPPGGGLLRVVDFFYSAVAVENIFKPIVVDWRTECFEALAKGRIWKARWINVRYTYRFLLAMGLNSLFSLLRSFVPTSR
jgi:hypothetical protein